MERPFYAVESIAAGGTSAKSSLIQLAKTRTVSLTVQIQCGSSINANPAIYVYYSPDDKNWDTIVYTSFALTYSAGSTIQRTVVIDPPEQGSLCIAANNGSSVGTLTNIKAWYSIQAWG